MGTFGTMALAALLTAAPRPASLRAQLESALMGEDALGTVRRIAALPKARLAAEGLTVEENHEEGYDEVIRIRLRRPLVIQGAATRCVTLSFDAPTPGLSALVYAEFEGDLEAFARAIGLQKGPPQGTSPVGVWNRALPGEPLCPMVLGATASGPGRFFFGCGWCNG